MRAADVFFQNMIAGKLIEIKFGREYHFVYEDGYKGYPISLTMPIDQKKYEFDSFPPFFDGLLPEGYQLEAMLRQNKLDQNDKFSQMVHAGADTVGAVTVKEAL
jgi:serine/threonine-protein kinase HipA